MTDRSQSTVDEREQHIRALARLMAKRGEALPADIEEHLQHHEYGLALYALAHEILHPDWKGATDAE